MKIEVRVVSNSKKQKIEKIEDKLYKIFIKSVPEKGKANKEITELFASYFKKTKDSIKIISGNKFKKKILEIVD